MDTVTSFRASDVPADQLNEIASNYLALERLRAFRQALMRRCGLLALAAVVGSRLIPGMSVAAHWVPLGIFSLPPVFAWVAEIRYKKVIKSSLTRHPFAPSRPSTAP